MTLSRGRDLLAIPGPSIIPDRVLNAMHRAAPNIYEGDLIAITESVLADLKRVARTEGEVALYIGNGHAAWEASIANLLAPGDRALFLVTGRFGLGWATTARQMGVEAEVIDFGFEDTVDAARVAERLAADRDRAIRAVFVVQADTASSVLNDVRAVRAALDAAGHPALLAVDCDREPRLRPLRDGRLGRRRDGRGLPEGADDAARPRDDLPRAAGRGGAGALPEPLLGLGAADGAGALLPALLRDRADPSPLRAAGRPRHDPRRGGARGGVAAARRLRPRGVGGGRGLGRPAGRSGSTSPTPPCAATRLRRSAPSPATARACGAGAPTPPA